MRIVWFARGTADCDSSTDTLWRSARPAGLSGSRAFFSTRSAPLASTAWRAPSGVPRHKQDHHRYGAGQRPMLQEQPLLGRLAPSPTKTPHLQLRKVRFDACVLYHLVSHFLESRGRSLPRRHEIVKGKHDCEPYSIRTRGSSAATLGSKASFENKAARWTWSKAPMPSTLNKHRVLVSIRELPQEVGHYPSVVTCLYSVLKGNRRGHQFFTVLLHHCFKSMAS